MRHRVYKRRGYWYVDFTDMRTGKRVWRATDATNRRQADAILAKITTENVERGYFEDRKPLRTLFEDFVSEYLAWAKTNKRSWRDDEIWLNRFRREWPGKLLSEITPHMVEQYKAKRCQEPRKNTKDATKLVSRNTVNHELCCLKAFFNKAILWEKANTNPVKFVRAYRVDDRRMVYLNREQIHQLLEACKSKVAPHLLPMVQIALNTGMRRGEILNLRWEDIDYKGNVINIRESKSDRKRGVPMNETVLEALRACVNVEALVEGRSPYVFCDKTGKPYADIKKGFNNAKARAGLPWLHFHDLRHTFASHLLSNGTDITVIRDLLGHKSLTMTLRYSHLSRDKKQDAVQKLPAIIGNWHSQPNKHSTKVDF